MHYWPPRTALLTVWILLSIWFSTTTAAIPTATAASYLSISIPTRKAETPSPLFNPSWINTADATRVTVEQFLEATAVCKAHFPQQLQGSSNHLLLIRKLIGQVFDLNRNAEDDKLDKSRPAARVAAVFASRELIACLIRKYAPSTKDDQKAAGELSVQVLLYAVLDMKLIAPMLQSGIAAGQAIHLLSSNFNAYLLSMIAFQISILEDALQGSIPPTRSAYLAAIAPNGYPAAPQMSYSTYTKLVMFETLNGRYQYHYRCQLTSTIDEYQSL